MIIQTMGNLKKSFEWADEQWSIITDVISGEDDIRVGSEYYEEKMKELYEEVYTLEYESGTGEIEIGD
jgi:hypothetical protein